MTAYTWLGPSGTTTSGTSGDWSTAGNWGPAGPPGGADSVNLTTNNAYTVTISTPVTITDYGQNTSPVLTIGPTGSLTAQGSFYTFGLINIYGPDTQSGAPQLTIDGAITKDAGSVKLYNNATVLINTAVRSSELRMYAQDNSNITFEMPAAGIYYNYAGFETWGTNTHLVILGATVTSVTYAGGGSDTLSFKYYLSSDPTQKIMTGAVDAGHNYAANVYSVQNTNGNAIFTNTNPVLLCFGEGTRISTPDGDVPVESLEAGHLVLTADGEALPVRWLARRTCRAEDAVDPDAVWPVLVQKGAFGPGLPARDLRLSPMHAVFLDGHLIPIRSLINGRSVRQSPVAAIRYFHVELDRHAVILAEGMPAESYLETGDRGAFENGGTDAVAGPEAARAAYLANACAPFAETGPVVERARLRLLRRLPELGHARAPAAVLEQVAALAA